MDEKRPDNMFNIEQNVARIADNTLKIAQGGGSGGDDSWKKSSLLLDLSPEESEFSYILERGDGTETSSSVVNVKTINGKGILGEGNIDIEGGSIQVDKTLRKYGSPELTGINFSGDEGNVAKAGVDGGLFVPISGSGDDLWKKSEIATPYTDTNVQVVFRRGDDSQIKSDIPFKTIKGNSLLGEGDINIVGDKGDPGASATIAITDTITTGPGSNARFEETEDSTSQNRKYIAYVPQGEKGDPATGGVPTTRKINTDSSLKGGGDLSKDLTLGISDSVIGKINNSYSGLYEKPAENGYMLTAVVSGEEQARDVLWKAVPVSSGDMLKSTYDPMSIGSDAFDMDNMADGETNRLFTTTEKNKLNNVPTNTIGSSSSSGSLLVTDISYNPSSSGREGLKIIYNGGQNYIIQRSAVPSNPPSVTKDSMITNMYLTDSDSNLVFVYTEAGTGATKICRVPVATISD